MTFKKDKYDLIKEKEIQHFLVGKKIKRVILTGHDLENCDSINIIKLIMTNGEIYDIVGSYGSYTGQSCDEYTETINVIQVLSDPSEEKKDNTKGEQSPSSI